ncbi:MAG: HU family DNA-binding protein [Nocardioides sp.]|jgi:DNA-binding protein HU-beta
MKKDELVSAIAESTDLSKADADRALKAVVDAITGAVASGDKVQIPGLGTFEPRERSAREGRNPQTGETIQIAATTAPGFKAATAFKDAVAGK